MVRDRANLSRYQNPLETFRECWHKVAASYLAIRQSYSTKCTFKYSSIVIDVIHGGNEQCHDHDVMMKSPYFTA